MVESFEEAEGALVVAPVLRLARPPVGAQLARSFRCFDSQVTAVTINSAKTRLRHSGVHIGQSEANNGESTSATLPDRHALDRAPWRACKRSCAATRSAISLRPARGEMRATTERKTGVIRAVRPFTRIRVRDGGLDVVRRAA